MFLLYFEIFQSTKITIRLHYTTIDTTINKKLLTNL